MWWLSDQWRMFSIWRWGSISLIRHSTEGGTLVSRDYISFLFSSDLSIPVLWSTVSAPSSTTDSPVWSAPTSPRCTSTATTSAPPGPTSWVTCARGTAGAASCTGGRTAGSRSSGSSPTGSDAGLSLKVRLLLMVLWYILLFSSWFQEKHFRQYLEEWVLWSNGSRERPEMEVFVEIYQSVTYCRIDFNHKHIIYWSLTWKRDRAASESSSSWKGFEGNRMFQN